MNFYCTNGMKAFSLILIIILSNIKHNAANEMKFYSGDYGNNKQQVNEISEAKRAWKNLQGIWSEDNESAMDNYNMPNMISSHYDKNDSNAQKYASLSNSKSNEDITNIDKRLWKLYNQQETGKRQGKGSWNNLRSTGWGKREGNWNNLRGLWGKRSDSSWEKLHGSWGRK